MAKQAKKAKKAEKERTLLQEIISTIIYMVVVCACVYLIITFVGQRTVVDGPSMCDTLQDGESLIMDKISYRFRDPERFEIVIFPGLEEGDGESPYYIKRVIGLPGETVQIKDGKIYINDKELTDDVYGIVDYIDWAGIAEEPLKLGDDEYFCMGDNRPVSLDCRAAELGPIQRDEFVGRAWIRIWPLSKFGKIDKE